MISTLFNWIIGLLAGGMIGYGVSLAMKTDSSHDESPFTRIGQMATGNGMAVEIFSFDHSKAHCIIAVEQVPSQVGRAAMQMVCK